MKRKILANTGQHSEYPGARKMTRAVLFLFLAFISMSLMLPLNAFAESGAGSGSQFTFAPDSYFINVILQGILGTVVQSGANAQSAGQTISATGTNTLGAIFKTFDIGVAFFGSIMIVFTTIVGVLQSGNDGEFLGRKWSSMWVPIRFATGSALMLPLTSSGYSYCQAIVLWIAGQGVGFADTLWNTIVSSLIVKNGMTLSQGVDMGTVTRSMALSELCAAVVNSRNTIAEAAVDNGPSVRPIGLITTDNMLHYVRTFKMNWNRSGLDAASSKASSCGSVTYAVKSDAVAMSDPYKDVRIGMMDYHKKELPELAKKYREKALKIADKYAAQNGQVEYDPRNDLLELADLATEDAKNYVPGMGAKVTQLLVDSGYKTQTTAHTDDITKYGFAMAGLWYMELLKVHNTARFSLNAPTAGAPNLSVLASDPGYGNFVVIFNDATNIIASALSSESTDIAPNTSSVPNDGATIRTTTTNFSISTDSLIASGAADGISTAVSNWLREVVFGVGQSSNGTSNKVWSMNQSNNRDPNVSTILQLKDKGDTILNVTGIIMALDISSKVVVGLGDYADRSGIVGSIANTVTSLLGGVAKMAAYAIEKMGSYLIGAAVSLFLFGVMLSVYVPMIPYILWVGALLGLVILILESLVAIMLWAVMMMHPSGDGITSDYNRQGLNMLLAIFMRPSLLLMGMVLGMFMVEPMVMFVNDTFYVVMQSVQGNSLTLLFSTIAFIAIYVSLIMMIVEKSFSMIHIVPDRVLTWIGGPGALTGEEAEITRRAQGMISGAGGAANTILLSRRSTPTNTGGGGDGGGGGGGKGAGKAPVAAEPKPPQAG